MRLEQQKRLQANCFWRALEELNFLFHFRPSAERFDFARFHNCELIIKFRSLSESDSCECATVGCLTVRAAREKTVAKPRNQAAKLPAVRSSDKPLS